MGPASGVPCLWRGCSGVVGDFAKAKSREQDLILIRSNSVSDKSLTANAFAIARHLPLRCARWLAICVLSFTLLTPSLTGLLLLAQDGDCSCKMGCCKTGRSSCCHHSRQSSRPDGAGWVSSPGCPSGCGQAIGGPSPLSTTLAVSRLEVGAAVVSELVWLHASPPHTSGGGEFALFGRPPPFLSVSS